MHRLQWSLIEKKSECLVDPISMLLSQNHNFVHNCHPARTCSKLSRWGSRAFVSLDVRWTVKSRGLVVQDVRWTVKYLVLWARTYAGPWKKCFCEPGPLTRAGAWKHAVCGPRLTLDRENTWFCGPARTLNHENMWFWRPGRMLDRENTWLCVSERMGWKITWCPPSPKRRVQISI